jgi:hypothetical protein
METPDTPSSIIPDLYADPIAELTASIQLGKTLAKQASADLEAATPVLVAALQHDSGQSRKIRNILWSCWNDDLQINLCTELAGIDSRLAQAAVAMIGARAHLSGDADEMLRRIIDTDREVSIP